MTSKTSSAPLPPLSEADIAEYLINTPEFFQRHAEVLGSITIASPHGARVRISTQRRGQLALVKVTNTVPAGQGQAGHGIALSNVGDRLRLLHDLQGGFRTALVDGVYQARIEVPLQP